EYASVYANADSSKTYADAHKDDDLLYGLKSMLEDEKQPSMLGRFVDKALYCYQRFLRKYTDVVTPVLNERTEAETEKTKAVIEREKKNVKHWKEFERRYKKRHEEFLLKESARQLSERCFLIKNKSHRKH